MENTNTSAAPASAGPHIVGVVALILSARPDLAGEVDLLEDLLENTAIKTQDASGCGGLDVNAIPNNTYGYGRVDALAFLQAALALSPVESPAEQALSVRVLPNPVSTEAFFNIENLSGHSNLQLFTTDGKLVYSKNWLASSHEIVQVPLEQQSAGVYFWQITSETGTTSGKLVKE